MMWNLLKYSIKVQMHEKQFIGVLPITDCKKCVSLSQHFDSSYIPTEDVFIFLTLFHIDTEETCKSSTTG